MKCKNNDNEDLYSLHITIWGMPEANLNAAGNISSCNIWILNIIETTGAIEILSYAYLVVMSARALILYVIASWLHYSMHQFSQAYLFMFLINQQCQ